MESPTNARGESSGTDFKYLLELCVETRIIRIREEVKEKERKREGCKEKCLVEISQASPRGFKFTTAKRAKAFITVLHYVILSEIITQHYKSCNSAAHTN